jgi:hypothetical protein
MSPSLYRVEPGDGRGELSVTQVWEQDGAEPLGPGYRHLFPVRVAGDLILVGVDEAGAATAFRVDEDGPGITPVESAIDLDGPRDVIEPFVLGNVPHLLAYTSKEGQFAFIPLGDDLSSKPPYRYRRAHEPGVTRGFDVTYPMSVGGAIYYMCYGFDSGNVFIYSLKATSTSPPSSAPLVSGPVWIHQWARRWTRFAFFQLGGENFFLKTNVGRLNVNIDHVLDDPADGTVEVATYLDLEDALDLDIVRSFYLESGDPYFLTYMRSGKTTVNRFRGDCRGWTTQATLTAPSDATHVVPLQFGDRCLVLFY